VFEWLDVDLVEIDLIASGRVLVGTSEVRRWISHWTTVAYYDSCLGGGIQSSFWKIGLYTGLSQSLSPARACDARMAVTPKERKLFMM
jgi:hypothetical protein